MRAGEPWQADARCEGVEPDAMFPTTPQGAREVIRALCSHCPVAAECLTAARANSERFGVWGGQWMEGSIEVRAPRVVPERPDREPSLASRVREWAAAQGIVLVPSAPVPLRVRRAWTRANPQFLVHGTRSARVFWGCECEECADVVLPPRSARGSSARSA